MKKHILLIFLCIAYLFSANAQTTTTFRTNYDSGGLLEIPANATESVTTGNYIFAGVNLGIPVSSYITEVDGSGDLVWSKRYGGSFTYQLSDFKKDAATNRYYVCGGNSSGSAVFMIVDATGTPVVSKNFSISEGTGTYLNRVIKTSDGGYVAVGYVNGYDPDGVGAEIKFNSITYVDADGDTQTEQIGSPLMVKFDANGNHLWHHVTRYYKNNTLAAAQRIYNDASFVDVVEVSDGYIAVGSYDVNDFRTSTNSDGDDNTSTDALFFKTTAAGVITYHRQIDTPNTSATASSKSFSAAAKTAAGLPLFSGQDGSGRPCLLMRFPGSGGWADPLWTRKYGGGSFFGTYNPLSADRFFETSDGNYAFTGMYLVPLSLSFNMNLTKINPTSNAVLFSKDYSAGLITIFSVGEEVSDGGYLSVSMNNNDNHIVKTDPMGVGPVACPAVDLALTSESTAYTYGTPNYNVWSANTVVNNSVSPTVTPFTPTVTVQCETIISPCTAPAAATTTTATPSTICQGSSSSLTASGPATGVSYNVYTAATGGTNLGETPLSVSPTSTTTYYIETVTTGNTSCVSTTRTPVTVTVTPTPSATAGSNSPICIGQTINLTANTVSGASYAWTGPNGFTSTDQNPSILNATATHAGTYSLTITSASCPSTVSTTTVVVNNVPTATPSSNSPICSGETLNLTANTVASASYAWTGPNGFTSTDQNPSITNTTAAHAGTYTLTITAGCSSSPVNTVVTINSSPTATAGGNTPICEGIALNLTSNTVAGASYAWTGPNGFVSTDQNPTIDPTTVTNAGTYSLIVSANGCSSTASTIQITINPSPTATVGSNSPLCIGDDLNLTANTVVGATYAWTGPNGFTSTDQNPSILNVQSTHAGNYTLTITANGCSSTSSIVNVGVNSAASVSATTNGPVCEGAQINLTASSGTSYAWTGPNGFTSTNQNPTISNASQANAGLYEVTITTGLCSNTAQVTLAVTPQETFTSNSTPVSCFGNSTGSATVNTSGTGPYTYAWSPNGGTNATASNLAAGSYTVSVSYGGCTTSQSVTISEPSAISSTISATETSCTSATGTATVVPSGGTSPYTYAWAPTGGNGATASNLSNGSYTVTITDANQCQATNSITVGTLNGPSLALSNVQNESCAGQSDGSATASVTGGTLPYTYSWQPTGGNTANASNLSAGNYTILVTDAAGCTATDNFTINSGSSISATPSINNASCGTENGSISILASGGTGNYTFVWLPNVSSSASATNLPAGDYQITTSDQNGCSTTNQVTVGIDGSLIVDIDPSAATIIEGNNIPLTTSVLPAVNPITYTWTPSTSLSCSDCPDPVASPTQTTTYIVTATSPDGCVGSDTIEIKVKENCKEFFIPTSFSPNNDNTNDLLCIYGDCITSLDFRIYDRWGELVFKTDDYQICWDGTYKGKMMNAATFVYQISVSFSDGTSLSEKGNISLVK